MPEMGPRPTKSKRVNGWSQTQFERRRSRKTISSETFILHQLFSLFKHFGTQTEAWKGKLMERKIRWERNFNKTSSGIFGDWLDERWKQNFVLFLFLGWIDESESITSWLWLSVDNERKSRQLRLRKYKWIEIFSPFTDANEKKVIIRPSIALQHSFYFPIKILVNIDDANVAGIVLKICVTWQSRFGKVGANFFIQFFAENEKSGRWLGSQSCHKS